MLLAFAGVGAPAAQRLAASTFPLQISVILVVVLVTSCIATGGGRGEEEEEVGNDWAKRPRNDNSCCAVAASLWI